jgi:hypothetical protein
MRLLGTVVFNDEVVLDDVDRLLACVLFTPAQPGRKRGRDEFVLATGAGHPARGHVTRSWSKYSPSMLSIGAASLVANGRGMIGAPPRGSGNALRDNNAA